MAELLETVDATRNARAQPAQSSRDPRTPEQSFAYLMAAAAAGVAPPPASDDQLSGGSWAHRVGASADATALAEQKLARGNSRHDPQARLAGMVEPDAPMQSSDLASEASTTTDRAPTGERPAGGSTASLPQQAAPPRPAGAPASPAAPPQPPAPAADSKIPSTDVPPPAPQPVPPLAVGGATPGGPAPGGSGMSKTSDPQPVGGAAKTNGSASGNADNRMVSAPRQARLTVAAGPKGAASEKPAPGEAPVAQAMRGLAALLRNKGGRMTMRLAPEALGELRVSMRLEKDRVWAKIEASSDSARDLLKDQGGSLRSALEARGLRVERLEIAASTIPTDRGAQDGLGARTDAWGGLAGGDPGDRQQPPERGLSGPGGAPGIVASDGAEEDEQIVWLRGTRPGTWAEPSASGVRWRVDAVA